MGTRGLIIIKHNKQIKVSQYCQFDMYYDGHGKHIAEILQKMLKDNVYDHFKQLVSNLKFVDDDYLQEKYQGKVATQFLRNTASDIFPLIIQGVQEFYDCTDYLFGPWLSYAYMIDLDRNELLVYTTHSDVEGPRMELNGREAAYLIHHHTFKINRRLLKKYNAFVKEFYESMEEN